MFETQFGEIRVKIAESYDGVITNIHPEYDDIKKAALRYKVAPIQIYRHVMMHAEHFLQSRNIHKRDTNG